MAAESMPTPSGAGLDRRRLRTTLLLILIGGLIVIVDFTISGTGRPTIDVFHDAVGFILLTIGFATLVKEPGPQNHGWQSSLLVGIAVSGLVWSIAAQAQTVVVPPIIVALVGGVTLGSAVLFSFVMRELTAFHGLSRATESWRRTLLVVATVWGAAWLLSSILAVVSPQGSAYVELGGPAAVPLVILGLAVILIPCIYLISSISVTRAELRAT